MTVAYGYVHREDSPLRAALLYYSTRTEELVMGTCYLGAALRMSI